MSQFKYNESLNMTVITIGIIGGSFRAYAGRARDC
jgi:hypothetical protein